MIIGVTGYARSGKDTVCNLIRQELGYDKTERIALADHLKDFVNDIFGWNDKHRNGVLKEVNMSAEYKVIHFLNCVDKYFSNYLEKEDILRAALALEDVFNEHLNYFQEGDSVVRVNTSPRLAYQVVGTEWARHLFDEGIWIRILEDKRDKNKITIVPDIRFENEVDWILTQPKKYSCLIGVDRKGREDIGTTHASESYIQEALLRVDYEINNNSNLENLNKKVVSVLQNIQA